ncbi:hypothetical protein, partial [Citrobacter freundii]|uniref:hypothetical protein n=1 Tax=Citrobacter freundii TaxID=546 RepID=UPI0028F9A577
WKPPAHSPEENMVRQKCSGIRRSYLVTFSFVIYGFNMILPKIQSHGPISEGITINPMEQ